MMKMIKDVIASEIKVFWGSDPIDVFSSTPVIKTNNLSYEGKISFENIALRNIDKTKIKDNYLRYGDLLIEKSGGTKTHSVGYVNYFEEIENLYVANNFILVLRPNPEVIKSKYLFYQMRYYYESGKFANCYNKTTGIQNLKKDIYLSKEIKVPNFNEQDMISLNLENIEKMIKIKKNELKLMDGLIKSRFIEMFISKGYPEMTLKDLSLAKAEYGAGSASVPYEEGRPRYVRITDINDDGTLNDDVVCSINHQDDVDYKLSYGDFMFARMGATVGKTYAFFKGNEIYAGYLIRYKLDLTKINPRYLFTYSKLDEYALWVKNNQSGAAQPGISAKKYDMLLIPVAPIDLQNEFGSFVEQIDKSKFVCHSRYFL